MRQQRIMHRAPSVPASRGEKFREDSDDNGMRLRRCFVCDACNPALKGDPAPTHCASCGSKWQPLPKVTTW